VSVWNNLEGGVHGTEPAEGPPVPPGRGTSRMFRGLMLRNVWKKIKHTYTCA